MTKIVLPFALAAAGLLAQAPTPGAVVRLYPVALDASGQPVTDLTADDFKIVDGKPQTVSSFQKPRNPAAAGKHDVLEFSNRSGKVPHATVILFDLMNQNQPDRLDMWKALDKALPSLESGEDLYFYIMTLEGNLVPVHPIGPPSAGDATWPKDSVAAFDAAMKAASHGRPVNMGQENQAKATFHQLEVLANQLALFPGRRDIIWIANGMQNAYNPKLPCSADWVECALYVPHLAVTLAGDEVAVDPLSNGRDVATGTTGVGGMDTRVANRGQALGNNGVGMSGSQGAQGIDPGLDLTQMARLTGGHAYFHQDIRTVIAQIEAAAKGAYELTYTPSADNWDSKWHVIHATCSRPGVRLQLRERYYALPDSRSPGDKMKAVLMQAFQSPGDFPGIGLRVKIAPIGEGKPGVHLDVTINATDLHLEQQVDKYAGAIYLLISDLGAAGPLGDPVVLNLAPALTADQYKSALKDGIPFPQDHPTTGAVQRVRVIVLDQNSLAVGSVTFPVK